MATPHRVSVSQGFLSSGSLYLLCFSSKIMHHYIACSKCSVSILFWNTTPYKNYSNMHRNISHFCSSAKLSRYSDYISSAVTLSSVSQVIIPTDILVVLSPESRCLLVISVRDSVFPDTSFIGLVSN